MFGFLKNFNRGCSKSEKWKPEQSHFQEEKIFKFFFGWKNVEERKRRVFIEKKTDTSNFIRRNFKDVKEKITNTGREEKEELNFFKENKNFLCEEGKKRKTFKKGTAKKGSKKYKNWKKENIQRKIFSQKELVQAQNLKKN